jgi:hypothetical protein
MPALLIASLIAALVVAMPASAVSDTKPVPGCNGLAFKDAVGDAIDDPTGLGAGSEKAEAYADITGGFFLTDAKETTANIQVADLKATVPAGAGQTVYYMFFELPGGTEELVKAEVTAAGTSFFYGTYDEATGTYTKGGDTTGKLFEGKDGIVQVVVPAEWAKAGATLNNTHADVDFIRGANDEAGLNTHSDRAPDAGAGGKKHVVAPCPAGGAPAPGGTPAPGSTPAPGTTPAPASGPLPVNLPISLGKAAKAKKGKKIVLKLRSTKPVTNLKVEILAKSGKGKALATGKLKSINGAGKVTLKVAKALKKGKYTLRATGTVDGRSATVARQSAAK